MNELEDTVGMLLLFCCHEWFTFRDDDKPLHAPEQLGDVPAYSIPSELVVAVAVAHNRILLAKEAGAPQKNAAVFPADTVNLDSLPNEPEPV